MTILNKWYTEEDFVELKYDVGGDLPEIKAEQTAIIDKKTGVLKRSHQEYTIKLANEYTYNLEQSETTAEVIGEIEATIESDLELVNVSSNNDDLLSMVDYVSSTKFIAVDLTKDGGKAEVFDQDISNAETWSIENQEMKL